MEGLAVLAVIVAAFFGAVWLSESRRRSNVDAAKTAGTRAVWGIGALIAAALIAKALTA